MKPTKLTIWVIARARKNQKPKTREDAKKWIEALPEKDRPFYFAIPLTLTPIQHKPKTKKK